MRPLAPKKPPVDPMMVAKARAAKLLLERHFMEYQRLTMHHYREVVEKLAS